MDSAGYMCVHLYICVCMTIIKTKNKNKEVMNLRWSGGGVWEELDQQGESGDENKHSTPV